MRIGRALLVVALAIFLSSCWMEHDDEMVPFLEGLPNRLVVVFQENVDLREVNSFLDEHTHSKVPHPRGGYPLRPEVGGVLSVDIHDHLGYEIGFYPNVTAEQIAAIKREMLQSRLVYRIYENVDPDEIVLD